VVWAVLGTLRNDLLRPPVNEGPYCYVWVTEFPLFEGLDDEGRPIAAHHPFTMPYAEDLDLLEGDPLEVRSQAYDLVLNGWELGSGSIRVHDPETQFRVFSALGLTPAEAEERFGFLLRAFRYGAPPHGGFAIGMDRFTALLAGEENIREVIAFPKSQRGLDLMFEAPDAVGLDQIEDLGLAVASERSVRLWNANRDES
jgi:aspartyl-tRNA synthetase